jgi:nitrate reductase NapE component
MNKPLIGVTMSDNELKLQREVQELKAEARRLRRIIESTLAIFAVLAILIFPQLLILVAVATIGFFGFLFSPLGRRTFPYSFHRKE